MKHGLVTVVLPIYNVEQYLNRCIESVVNQTYINLEIILVDDGSTDHCPELCEKWAKKDERIKVIHKKNAGLGMARNTGIENATGEYICFFDSDDYVALHAVERVYACAKQCDAEIVLFGFVNVGAEGKIRKSMVPHTVKDFYEGTEVQDYILPNLIAPDPQTGIKTNLWMSAWACMYSMELIQRTEWRFVSERQYISEDVYSHLLLYKEVNRVKILSEPLYFYCENTSSLTHTFKKDRYDKIKYLHTECLKICDEFGYSKRVKDRLSYSFISNTIAALKMVARANCKQKEKKCAEDMILKDGYLYNIISGMDLKYEKWTRKVLLLAIKYRLYALARLMVIMKA